jgi:hypothetical protein
MPYPYQLDREDSFRLSKKTNTAYFPLPWGEEKGEVLTDFSQVITCATKVAENFSKVHSVFPLPWGRGKGEGEPIENPAIGRG